MPPPCSSSGGTSLIATCHSSAEKRALEGAKAATPLPLPRRAARRRDARKDTTAKRRCRSRTE